MEMQTSRQAAPGDWLEPVAARSPADRLPPTPAARPVAPGAPRSQRALRVADALAASRRGPPAGSLRPRRCSLRAQSGRRGVLAATPASPPGAVRKQPGIQKQPGTHRTAYCRAARRSRRPGGGHRRRGARSSGAIETAAWARTRQSHAARYWQEWLFFLLRARDQNIRTKNVHISRHPTRIVHDLVESSLAKDRTA